MILVVRCAEPSGLTFLFFTVKHRERKRGSIPVQPMKDREDSKFDAPDFLRRRSSDKAWTVPHENLKGQSSAASATAGIVSALIGK